MELQIPQTFKVQWLITTLKFIKDDTQLVKDYPQMPYGHVEYLHNLIWQRKNDVGLGFKSLYSPVWEAMKIYSLKYQFKIVVKKSEDGTSGNLIMEKIPKINTPTIKLNDEEKDKNNNYENKKRDNVTMYGQNSEVATNNQTEAVKCKQPKTKPKRKRKNKKLVPQMPKEQTIFMENQDILDSLSPLFIKMMLKLILDFLSDELNASKTFSSLAPMESRFLENFLSIYERKNDLGALLSPACNEILTEISKCFDDFSKTCCLEISCVSVDSNTNKREIKYTKVPVLNNKKMAEQKLEENSIQTKTVTVSSNDATKNIINMPCISKEGYNMTVEKNVTSEVKKSLQIKVTGEVRHVINKPINNYFIDASSASVKEPNDVKTNTNLKDKSLNKSVPLPNNSITLTNGGTSSAADILYNRVEQKSLKIKVVQDVTEPLSSNKTESVTLPVTSKSLTEKETFSIADTPSIKVEQKSPEEIMKKVLQDVTVPSNTDKALSQNSEVRKKPQTEATKSKQPETRRLKKEKTIKPIPEMSRGLKMFMENQIILDSLPQCFLKTMLNSILDFLMDELSASRIFSNLAPIESKFLENFLSIHQRKNDLKALLSPGCNEILTEISKCFDDFSKTCCLEISCIGVNSNTNKRSVKYTKVPVFLSKKKAKQKLREKKNQTKTTATPTNDVTTKLLNMPSNNNKYIATVQNASKDITTLKSKNKTNEFSEDNCANSEPMSKVIQTIDNNVIDALSVPVKKSNDVKPETTTYLKDTSLNKSVLLPKKSINFTKEGTSNTADTPYIKVEPKTPKWKILQDMTVPLNSDKGTRMMQLMGWKGGALGLRGDGITEPIIPTPNVKNCGLGHVSVKKKDSNMETRNQIRNEFINKVLKMIDNNMKVSVIKLQNQLNKREIKFLKLTIKLMNNRGNLDAEFEKRLEIKDKMLKNMDIIFNIDIEDENRKIVITRTSKKENKVNQNTQKDTKDEGIDTNAIQNTNSEATFKTIVLKSILELIKSEDKKKVIRFSNELKARHIQCTNTIILLINERQCVQQKNSEVVAELGSKILEAIGVFMLSVKINESERQIIITKTSKTDMHTNKVNQNTPKDTNAEDIDTNSVQKINSKAECKSIVLKAIFELIKSKDKEKVIRFSNETKSKHIQYSHIIILLINERRDVKQKNSRVVAELVTNILEVIGDLFLSVKINESERYIVIRKKPPKSNNQQIIKIDVNKAKSNENNENAFDSVRNYLRIKKKNQLLNDLYRYETEETEEFRENQWYNTVDKSLLESDKMVIEKTKLIRIN